MPQFLKAGEEKEFFVTVTVTLSTYGESAEAIEERLNEVVSSTYGMLNQDFLSSNSLAIEDVEISLVQDADV